MTTFTAALLLIGTCLAAFGTLAFLAAAPGHPDVETLRIVYLAAWASQRIITPALLLWLSAWSTTGPACALLLFLCGGALIGAHLVTRAAPELMRRAAQWSI